MDQFAERLVKLIQTEFPGAAIRVDPVNGAGRILGIVSWERFEGVDQIERQQQLWSVLRQNLTPDERSLVSAILTMTPSELSDDDDESE